MTRDELIRLVQRIRDGEGNTEHGNHLVDQVNDAIPNGGVIDLIFWPTQKMTPEQVVDEAMHKSAEWKRIQI